MASPKKRKISKWEPYLFLAPVLISMLALFGYPLINSIILAFTNYKLNDLRNVGFAGLENFAQIFQRDEYMGMIAMNSLKWVVFSVGVQFLLGMTLALALKKPFRGRNIYQSIVFLPWASSSFAVGLMFRWSFNGEYGVVNYILMKLGIISDKISWLGSSELAVVVPILAMI